MYLRKHPLILWWIRLWIKRPLP